MKSLNPLLLVLSGVLITVALFSFKNEEPVVEYCHISANRVRIDLLFGNGVIKKNKTSLDSMENDIITIINNMAKDGWKIKTSENFGSVKFDDRSIYLERIK